MARANDRLTRADVARDSYPRRVLCGGGCRIKYTVYDAADEEHIRRFGCIHCAREKMRAHALRDRRPLQGG
jgi:hypothetical protein